MNYPSGFFWFNVRSTEQYQWSLMTSNFIDFTQEGKREMERGDGEASFLMPSASPSRVASINNMPVHCIYKDTHEGLTR